MPKPACSLFPVTEVDGTHRRKRGWDNLVVYPEVNMRTDRCRAALEFGILVFSRPRITRKNQRETLAMIRVEERMNRPGYQSAGSLVGVAIPSCRAQISFGAVSYWERSVGTQNNLGTVTFCQWQPKPVGDATPAVGQ